jgi:hypothetical protein
MAGETAFQLTECAEISLNAKYSPLRQYGSCVGGSRNHMRTYQKLTVPSMMSFLSRFPPPIPCQSARQGKHFPYHCTEVRVQVVDFTGFSAGNLEKTSCIPLSGGKRPVAQSSGQGAAQA